MLFTVVSLPTNWEGRSTRWLPSGSDLYVKVTKLSSLQPIQTSIRIWMFPRISSRFQPEGTKLGMRGRRIALVLTGAVWLLLLLRLGLWHSTFRPADGLLSHTFNGWAEQPIARHLFLAQNDPNDFARGRAYSTHTYPFICFSFLFLAPLHFLLRLPYNVAHNFLSYLYVFSLMVLIVLTSARQLLAISEKNRLLLWILAFISIGISITDPVPWVSSLVFARNNPFILVAGSFCYLSTWVFHGQRPQTPLLIVGVFLALWSPPFIPAWILASLFFHRTLILERKLTAQVAGVCV